MLQLEILLVCKVQVSESHSVSLYMHQGMLLDAAILLHQRGLITSVDKG